MEAPPATALLADLRDHRALVAAAEAHELELVHAWAMAHPATGEQGLLSPDEVVGGEGTPAVAAFTAEPLAGALRTSPYAAQALLADTLDLHHRLPRLWDQVRALEVPVRKARQIVRATRGLPLEAARWVDRQLIGAAASIRAAALDRLVALAVARVEPEGQKDREEAARSTWDVRLGHPRDWVGTSELTAVGDTVALGEVLARIDTEAESLAHAGDEDGVGARRVKALLQLARHGAEQLAFGFAEAAEAAAKPSRPTGATPTMKLYVHTSLAELALLAAGDRSHAVEVEKLGAVTTDLLKSWVTQEWGRCRVTVTPVLDLAEATWSPRHDPAPRVRQQVILRHRGCVFPYCGRDARSADLDHVQPWEPDDPGGPGGTRPDNLAPLCRRHHRAKTDGVWRYDVLPDQLVDSAARPSRPPDHLWTGPHEESFLVTGGRNVAIIGS